MDGAEQLQQPRDPARLREVFFACCCNGAAVCREWGEETWRAIEATGHCEQWRAEYAADRLPALAAGSMDAGWQLAHAGAVEAFEPIVELATSGEPGQCWQFGLILGALADNAPVSIEAKIAMRRRVIACYENCLRRLSGSELEQRRPRLRDEIAQQRRAISALRSRRQGGG